MSKNMKTKNRPNKDLFFKTLKTIALKHLS